MDVLQLLTRFGLPFLARCRVPRDLESVTSAGDEAPAHEAGVRPEAVERVWRSIEALYRTGVHPAVQVCIRRHGIPVLHRSLGHAEGNAPDDPPDAPLIPVTTETPFVIFSAAKAVTAMLIHKLDEKRALHLEDRVCDFIPEFARDGKRRITIRHILSHRAGVPNLPPEAMDLGLHDQPERIVEILSGQRLQSRPGRILAYHAVSGGFILAEVVRRATGDDIRTVLEREICEPLGFRWMRYGVRPEDIDRVARNAVTGPPPPPPISGMLRRALGLGMREVVEFSNDPRFVTGVIPSANVVTTAEELSRFYQCLLDGGELDGVRVFEPNTVRHATSEQSYWEIDLTLGVPLRYGLGFMLGDRRPNLFGWDNPLAFGHLGFTNVFSWADPERSLSVAILTSGKPILSLHAVRLVQMFVEMHRAFPKVESEGEEWQRARGRAAAAAARRQVGHG
ncbi:MAG: beta-lactamase family protein [Myxococcales bacterium]|nr:beta-lactamase family protein [Myxococcales bacterium]